MRKIFNLLPLFLMGFETTTPAWAESELKTSDNSKVYTSSDILIHRTCQIVGDVGQVFTDEAKKRGYTVVSASPRCCGTFPGNVLVMEWKWFLNDPEGAWDLHCLNPFYSNPHALTASLKGLDGKARPFSVQLDGKSDYGFPDTCFNRIDGRIKTYDEAMRGAARQLPICKIHNPALNECQAEQRVAFTLADTEISFNKTYNLSPYLDTRWAHSEHLASTETDTSDLSNSQMDIKGPPGINKKLILEKAVQPLIEAWRKRVAYGPNKSEYQSNRVMINPNPRQDGTFGIVSADENAIASVDWDDRTRDPYAQDWGIGDYGQSYYRESSDNFYSLYNSSMTLSGELLQPRPNWTRNLEGPLDIPELEGLLGKYNTKIKAKFSLHLSCK